MTYASKEDLFVTAKKTRGIVICPRANASLADDIFELRRCRFSGVTANGYVIIAWETAHSQEDYRDYGCEQTCHFPFSQYETDLPLYEAREGN
jgi:hypothetical protein